MKITSRFAKVAGVILAAAAITISLAGCGGTSNANVNKDYLVLANVNDITCDAGGENPALNQQLQATANLVQNASTKQKNEILAMNKGLSDLKPLDAALTSKMEECSASPTSGSSAKPVDNKTTTLSPELKALLDASSAPMVDCVAIVKDTGGTVYDDTYSLFVKALLEVNPKDANLRQWSDALSTPLKGASPEEMHKWINRAICEEPVIGVSLAHLFAHLEVKGVSILSLQKTDWLKPFAVDASKIDSLVEQYVPIEVWKLESSAHKTPSDDLYAKAVTANHDYQGLASKLVFLLSRYQLGQVMSINSTHHYHLVAGGLRADGIPEVEISKDVDAHPALVFFLTEKTACKPISVLAFNTGDKRPMLGSVPENCEVLTTPPSTTPSTPTTPSNPGCTENCGGTPQCTHDCGNTPKSGDKRNYEYPADKPPVTVNTPAGPPAHVQTQQPGGNGVVDTPSSPPHSETGGTAPGATPAPQAPPATTPPNEGGNNGAGDTGGF